MTAGEEHGPAEQDPALRRLRERGFSGIFRHNPSSAGTAVAAAVVVAHDVAGGIPSAPIELTRETWDQFWLELAAPEAEQLNPAPSQAWQALVRELRKQNGTVTLDRVGPVGSDEHHEVMVELVGRDAVRVTFRQPGVPTNPLR